MEITMGLQWIFTGIKTQGKNRSYGDEENYYNNLGALVKRTECKYI